MRKKTMGLIVVAVMAMAAAGATVALALGSAWLPDHRPSAGPPSGLDPEFIMRW